jgi:hypothetical protein
MRDDIHRRLPLSRAWRRAIKAIAREAEADVRARPRLVEQAARSELKGLRPSVVAEARRVLSERQQSLFPGESFALVSSSPSPIEDAFLRECAWRVDDVRSSPDETLRAATEAALQGRVDAITREIQCQAWIDSNDSEAIVQRLSSAVVEADLGAVVISHLAGEPSQRFRMEPIHLDGDLRGDL